MSHKKKLLGLSIPKEHRETEMFVDEFNHKTEVKVDCSMLLLYILHLMIQVL